PTLSTHRSAHGGPPTSGERRARARGMSTSPPAVLRRPALRLLMADSSDGTSSPIHSPFESDGRRIPMGLESLDVPGDEVIDLRFCRCIGPGLAGLPRLARL